MVFQLLFNHRELEKTINMWKERFCRSFPTPYYLPHSDKRFRNAIKNTIHVFCMKKKRFSKLLLNRLHFAKKFNLGHDTRVHSFPTVYRKPHLAMFAEVQPSTRRSSGRTTQAVKLQKMQVHHDMRAKSANERDSYLKRAFSC